MLAIALGLAETFAQKDFSYQYRSKEAAYLKRGFEVVSTPPHLCGGLAFVAA